MPPILLTVYPDECDAFGHLNQASFLSLFERARWEMLRAGPGMDVFIAPAPGRRSARPSSTITPRPSPETCSASSRS